MQSIYLFDWGDTLMVDSNVFQGKMCDWPSVETVKGALETLTYLSQTHYIYIATGAIDSTENEIKRAFQRVGLSDFIKGYFCPENLKIEKGTSAFFEAIIKKLGVLPSQITMVGDNYEKDIKPAKALGMKVLWFMPETATLPNDEIVSISQLTDIINRVSILHNVEENSANYSAHQ